jgi:hypothetical protein
MIMYAIVQLARFCASPLNVDAALPVGIVGHSRNIIT